MNSSYYDYDVGIKSENNHHLMIPSTHLFPITNGANESYLLDLKFKNLHEMMRQSEENYKQEESLQSDYKKECKKKKRKFCFPNIEKELRRQQNAEHMREFRRNLPEIEKEKRRMKAAEYMREFRKNLPEVEKQIRRRIDTERMRRFRHNLPEIEKEIRKQKAKERMRKQREIMRLQSLSAVSDIN